MFNLKFAKMLDNQIFRKYNLETISEDYFKVINNSFCVADGVTRDTIDGNSVGYPKSEQEAKDWIQKYPNPSGAFEAAKVTSDTFVEEIEKVSDNSITEEVVRQSIYTANENVAKINKNRKINYIEEDYYCCEAVGGRIVNDTLYCFSIGDCHITLVDEDFNIIFTTINNHKRFEEFLDNVYSKNNKFDWNNAEDRKMVRKDYRNNPRKRYKGEEVSFGAISGELEAMHYVDTYTVDLKEVKYICAYSDGCEPFFEEKSKIKELITNLDIFDSEGKERTLVIYENS